MTSQSNRRSLRAVLIALTFTPSVAFGAISVLPTVGVELESNVRRRRIFTRLSICSHAGDQIQASPTSSR